MGQTDVEDSICRTLAERWQDSVDSLLYTDSGRTQRYLDSLGWLALRNSSDSLWIDHRMLVGDKAVVDDKLDAALLEYDSAFQRAYSIADSARVALALFNIGNVHFGKGDPIACLASMRGAMRFVNSKSPLEFRIALYNMVAVIYYYSRYYDKALEYFHKAEAICLENELDQLRAAIYVNMSSLHLRQHEPERALTYAYASLSILPKEETSEVREVKIYLGTLLANIYGSMHKMEWAKLHLDRAHAALQCSQGDTHYFDENSRQYFLHNAYYFRRVGLWDSALANCSRFLGTRAGTINPADLNQEMLKLLGEIYENKGDYRKALSYYERYRDEIDSIRHLQNPFRIAAYELSTQQEEYMQRRSHERLTANRDQWERESKSRWIAVALSTMIFSLVLFVRILIYYNHRNRQYYSQVLDSTARQREVNRRFSLRKRELEYQQNLLQQNNMLLLQSQRMHSHFVARVNESLTFVRTLQNALLPSEALLQERVGNHFALYLPRDGVSGDFYWCSPSDYPVRIVVLVDCAGHGIPGALLSMIGNVLLGKIVLEFKISDPAEIVNHLHEQVRNYLVVDHSSSAQIGHYSMDLSVIAYHPSSRTLRYCGANSQLYISTRSGVQRHRNSMISVGSIFQTEPFTSTEIELPRGEDVYFYLTSDGYTDQLNVENKKLGNSSLTKLLERAYHLPMEEQRALLLDAFLAHRTGCEQTDDVCVMGFQIPA